MADENNKNKNSQLQSQSQQHHKQQQSHVGIAFAMNSNDKYNQSQESNEIDNDEFKTTNQQQNIISNNIIIKYPILWIITSVLHSF